MANNQHYVLHTLMRNGGYTHKFMHSQKIDLGEGIINLEDLE